MKSTLLAIAGLAAKMGGFGLLILGILDSSFLLFMPLGNDLLMVALTAQHHRRLLYYAAMATAGSAIGCFLTDAVARKGGEEGLCRLLPPKRIEYVKKKLSKKAGWAIALAALMPPPFPFTAVIAAAAALQFPRKKLFSILVPARFARFSVIGLLGIFFGDGVLSIANSPFVEYTVIGVVIVSIVGSTVSVYRWIQRSRVAAQGQAAA
jgi:membrane protein YqaA with SNARE-associated domain